jgi:predicted ferric reductase
MEPIGLRFVDTASVFTSIGQILGLVGMTLFSINLILSGRFKFLDKYFKGLDKLYKNHQIIGTLAFSMILFHPIFLVFKYLAISTKEAALFFVPFLEIPITLGIISVFLMIILISLTFYFKLKYNIWKFSHKFMIIAFFFSLFHVVLIKSDISNSLLLKIYLLFLGIIGLFVSIRQAFFYKLINKKSYTVSFIRYLNSDIIEISMKSDKDKINFSSGQFAFFTIKNNLIKKESHPFSISSGPGDEYLKITVKNFGDYTASLSNLKIGDTVLVDGPYGFFSYKNIENKNQIWVAGGIGITPFFSMAKDLENEYNISLFYSAKDEKDMVYKDDFIDISYSNKNFKFNLWDTNKNGYINARIISDLSGGVKDKDIFICGPNTFMINLKDQFVSMGVDINNIHYENFSF